MTVLLQIMSKTYDKVHEKTNAEFRLMRLRMLMTAIRMPVPLPPFNLLWTPVMVLIWLLVEFPKILARLCRQCFGAQKIFPEPEVLPKAFAARQFLEGFWNSTEQWLPDDWGVPADDHTKNSLKEVLAMLTDIRIDIRDRVAPIG